MISFESSTIHEKKSILFPDKMTGTSELRHANKHLFKKYI